MRTATFCSINSLVEDPGDGVGPGSGREQGNLPIVDGMTQKNVALVEQKFGGSGSEVVSEGEVNVADGPFPAAYDALPVTIVTPSSPPAEHQGFALENRERPVAGRDSSQMRDIKRGLPPVAAPESPSFGRRSSFAATNRLSGFLSTSTQAALISRPRPHSLPGLYDVVDRRACGVRAGGDNYDDDENKIQEVEQAKLDAVAEQPRCPLVRKRRLSGGATSRAKIYRCEQCMQSFARSYNLKSHSLIHSNERPFLCEVCGTAFSRQHDLKRHAKLHTGEKPYRCGYCGRAFSRLDALNRHIRSEDVKNCAGGCNTPCASQHNFTAYSNQQEAQAHVQVQDESRAEVGRPLIAAGGTLRVLPTSAEESVLPPQDGPQQLITPTPKRAYCLEAAEQHGPDRRRQVVNTAGGLPHSQSLWWFPVAHTYKGPGPNRPPSQDKQPQQYHAQPMPVQPECSQRMYLNEHQQAVGLKCRHVSHPPEHAPASKALSVPTATSNSTATPAAPLSVGGLSSDGYARQLPRGSPGQDESAPAMEDDLTQAIRMLTAERDLIVDRVVFLEGQLMVERNSRKRLHALEAQVQQLEIEKRLLQSMVVGKTNHAFPLPVAGLHRYPAGGAIGFVAYDPGVILPSLSSSTPRPSSP